MSKTTRVNSSNSTAKFAEKKSHLTKKPLKKSESKRFRIDEDSKLKFAAKEERLEDFSNTPVKRTIEDASLKQGFEK